MPLPAINGVITPESVLIGWVTKVISPTNNVISPYLQLVGAHLVGIVVSKAFSPSNPRLHVAEQLLSKLQRTQDKG